MSARPRRGPTTAPAIHALLLFFDSSLPPVPPATGTTDGVAIGVLVGVEVIRLGDGDAEGERTPGILGQYSDSHLA
jgi:hypothetical protein